MLNQNLRMMKVVGTMSTTKALEFGGPTGNAPKSVGHEIEKNLRDGQQ